MGKVILPLPFQSRVEAPLHRPYDHQSRCAQAIDKVPGAHSSKEHIGIPGQSSGIGDQLAQNVGYLLV